MNLDGRREGQDDDGLQLIKLQNAPGAPAGRGGMASPSIQVLDPSEGTDPQLGKALALPREERPLLSPPSRDLVCDPSYVTPIPRLDKAPRKET
jgi:hypothetical protein